MLQEHLFIFFMDDVVMKLRWVSNTPDYILKNVSQFCLKMSTFPIYPKYYPLPGGTKVSRVVLESKQAKSLKSSAPRYVPGKLGSQPSSISLQRVSLTGGMSDTPGGLSHSGCHSLSTAPALECTHIGESSLSFSLQVLLIEHFPALPG